MSAFEIKEHSQIIKKVYRVWAYYLARILKNSFISANHITISRLFLILVASICIVNEGYLLKVIAAVLIVVFSMFDALDGSLAVLKNERSALGAWLDPQVDRLGFLILFVAIASYLSDINGNYVYLTFYTLSMFYFRGLVPHDVRLKDKFSLLREGVGANPENQSLGEIASNIRKKNKLKIIRRIHLQASPHTHNVALYISIGLILNIVNFMMIYLAIYISLWYLWENYKVIIRALNIEKKT